MQLGLPEAQLPLAQAAILLATAPKSNSVCTGIMSAWADVKAGRGGDVPRELQITAPANGPLFICDNDGVHGTAP